MPNQPNATSQPELPLQLQSQEHLRLLLENCPDVLVEVTMEGQITYISPNVERVLGYTAKEMIGRKAFEGMHPEDLPLMLDQVAQARGPATCRYRDKRGAWRWLEISGRDFVLPDCTTRAVLIVRDITERRRSEEALSESEEKFSKIFRSSPGAMGISDLESRQFIEVNDGYSSIFGYPRSEFIGRSALEMGLWDGEEDRQRFIKTIMEKGTVRNMEIACRTKSGNRIHCLLSADIIELEGRKCVVTSLHDTTAFRKAESERASLEAQLRHVQKLEAVGTLAGGIAHDFNNILAAIMGYTEMARLDAGKPETVRNHLAHVNAACDRAKDLVRRILTFSRRQQQERKPLKAQLVIGEALKLLRSTIPATVEITSRIAEETPLVLADPTQVHQVVMNLCMNAAHAMRNTSGKLTVTLAPQAVDETMAALNPGLRPGLYTRLAVSDTGHGMDPETLKRIYEPFFTTKAPGEGSGLGLPVVHGIVKEHEGTITVQSEPGKGTTFHVYFPALPDLAAEIESNQIPAPRGNGELILFVDDEPAICDSMRSVLERLGYRVIAQSCPEAALRRFRKTPSEFDLVIVDLAMPHMTGVELARAILPLRPQVPVLLASGSSGILTLERVQALGICDLIIKPVNMAELGQAVERALKNSTGKRITGTN